MKRPTRAGGKRKNLTLPEALALVKAGHFVTRKDPHWREHLRWGPTGLVNNTIDSPPTGICLMDDDVFAKDWMLA